MKNDWSYILYMLKHKLWVVLAGVRWTKAPLWALLVHDLSKLSKQEFVPYRDWFYAERSSKNRAAFQAAVSLHKRRNPHPWEFWSAPLADRVLGVATMPDISIREMVTDWHGAGRAIFGSWDVDAYGKEKDNMQLHPTSRSRAEESLIRFRTLSRSR